MKMENEMCRAKQVGDRYPPQVKSLKTWLDSVSTGESSKNVGGCKRLAVRPRKVLLPKKTQEGRVNKYHKDYGLCVGSQD